MDLIITTALTGLVVGGVLGIAHSYLRPLGLHPVANYVFGVSICLVAFFVAITTRTVWTTGEIAILTIGIWGISGIIVTMTYGLDSAFAHSRRNARQRARRDGDDGKE